MLQGMVPALKALTLTLEEHGEQVKQTAHRMTSVWVLCVCCTSRREGNSQRQWSVKAGAVGKHSRNAWTWAYPPPSYWPRKVSHLLVTCGTFFCLRKELTYILKYMYRPEERHWIDMSTPKLNSLILYLEFFGHPWRVCLQCRRRKRPSFNPWVGKIPWRKAWQPTPIFLPGESHGQRSLAGYSS